MIDKPSSSSTDVNENTLGKYQCDFCGRCLKSGAGRASHMRKCQQRNLANPVIASSVADDVENVNVDITHCAMSNSDSFTVSPNFENVDNAKSATNNADTVQNEYSENVDSTETIVNLTENSACVNSAESLRESDPLVCPFCNKTFKNKGGCTRHQKTCPSRENPESFTCRCALTFSSLGGLQLHRLRAHPEEYYREQPRSKKARWTESETNLLIRLCAEHTLKETQFVNEAIQEATGWGIESIKGKKKGLKLEIEKKVKELKELEATSEPEPITPIETNELNWASLIDTKTNGHLRNVNTSNHFKVICYYISTFYPNQPPKQTRTINPPKKPKSNQKLKKLLYRHTQKQATKNPAAIYEQIVNNSLATNVFNPPRIPANAGDYWKEVFERPSTTDTRAIEQLKACETIPQNITLDEIERELRSFERNTAAGPDDLNLEKFRCIPRSDMRIVLNSCTRAGKIPPEWKIGRTTLIPKTQDARTPEQFRPITVTSLWIRLLNKILARKLSSAIKLTNTQLGFQTLDGTAIAITRLDSVFRYAKINRKPLCVVTIDFEKAFDSVSHMSIQRSLQRYSVPYWLKSLVQDLYANSTTSIMNTKANINRGIKQGDPLSPILFNMVVDEILEDLGQLKLGPKNANLESGCIAYADDIALITDSISNQQFLVRKLEKMAELCGLLIKPSKCNLINWELVPKAKKRAITTEKSIKISRGVIKHVAANESFRYLGADMTVNGVAKLTSVGNLKVKLERLMKAPLKPQQRIFMLRTYLLPGYQHQLALMKKTKTEMLNYDKCLRWHVRKMLKMPKDMPSAIIHASIRDGGLGIQSFLTTASVLTLRRHQKAKSQTTDDRPSPKWMTWDSRASIANHWHEALNKCIDGKHLAIQRSTINCNSWIGEPTNLLTGADYIRCLKIRTNSVMTASRRSRMYHNTRPNCDAGCGAVETLGHIVQKCPRNWKTRLKRHDHLCKYITETLRNKGHRVVQETAFNCGGKGLKPDILVTIGSMTYIIDVTVCSDTDINSINRSYDEKLYLYSNLHLYDQVKTLTGSTDVEVGAIVISFRGIIAPRSANLLKKTGWLMREASLLTVKTLCGTIVVWKNHYRSSVQAREVDPYT